MELNDETYGIKGFQYQGKAIGGKIKTKISDFKVTEVDPFTNKPISSPPQPISYSFEEGGMFLTGRVWRQGQDHSKMVRSLAKAFRVREEDVSTAGIKDAKAEIVQLFSIYNPQKEVSDPLMLDVGLEIDSFTRSRERLYPGSMGGNYFDITIRECENIDQYELDYFGALAENNLLNYYGYQRFGSWRPITAELGRAIARQDYKSVIDIYLGGKSNQDDETYRKHWRESQDPDELLLIWDNIPEIERKILLHLSKRNSDYRGATSRFPQFLVNIAKSSFISLLTNEYFSLRGDKEELYKGERNIDDNIEIALPSNRWPDPLNDIWQSVFKKHQINMAKDLKNIRHTSRKLYLRLKGWNTQYIEDDVLEVKFQLENGQYATTVLRELMQSKPEAFF